MVGYDTSAHVAEEVGGVGATLCISTTTCVTSAPISWLGSHGLGAPV